MHETDPTVAFLIAGIPATNKSLYHAIRFSVGDPAALLALPDEQTDRYKRLLILRDIEMDRARKLANVDGVACPADFAPPAPDTLSGDRETATAQAVAQCMAMRGIETVVADRTLGLIYSHHLAQVGITVNYDPDMGVTNRRAKDEQEVAWLREAQQMTERAMALACGMVACATARADGVLEHDGAPLTAERVRLAIDVFLLEQGYTNPRSIIAGGPMGGDCHELGSGELRTGQSVIVDIFPQNRTTKYNGDCTRTVVHDMQNAPDEIVAMHAAVVQAKSAATAATRAGATGEQVHQATIKAVESAGYAMGFPTQAHPSTMPHGTGHGVGLEVHEPPLLDLGGPPLVVGDALTIEPGLYGPRGGVRVEDMVIVTAEGCDNLNTLHEGLDWRG